jgi:hypothetical protein
MTVPLSNAFDTYLDRLRAEEAVVVAQEIKFFHFDGQKIVKRAGEPAPPRRSYFAAHYIVTDGVITKDKATGTEIEHIVMAAVRADAAAN